MERNRAEGWQHAKLSGHKNEDLVTQLIFDNTDVQQELLRCAGKQGKVTGVAEGGLCEKSIPSVLDDETKAKPDIRLLLNDGNHVNVSVKKSLGGQVFLITVDRFIRGYEAQYSQTIPQQVKRAISIYWGAADDMDVLIEEYASDIDCPKQGKLPYEKRKHRLVKTSMDKYDPRLSVAMIEWFQENIVNIFDFCFVRGLAKNAEDWADVIWYKNMLPDEDDGDTLFNMETLRKQISDAKDKIVYGNRTGDSTIQLPFGFVQWHLGQMQFHHKLSDLKSL